MRVILPLLLIFAFHATDCYKFLVYSPIFGYSHMKYLGGIADLLADNGHQVTYFQPEVVDTMKKKKVTHNKNITVIDYEDSPEGKEYARKLTSSLMVDQWTSQSTQSIIGAIVFPKFFTELFTPMCKKIFTDKQLHEKFKNEQFDVLIAEPFDFCGLYFADIIKPKSVIVAFSAVRSSILTDTLGLSAGINSVPSSSVSYGFSSAKDRLNNLFDYGASVYTFNKVFETEYELVSSLTGGKVRHWTEIIADAAYIFTNANPYLDFPASSIAKIVDVGGFVMNFDQWKNAKLPEEFENILSERPTTVLVSFGSVIRSADMPKHFRSGLIKTFKSMPETTFLWKYEEDDSELEKQLPANVHLSKWVPQPALLADDRVKVFITHGGLGSTMEVAYSGKPAVCIPLFGDQPTNAEMLARHGGAVKYDKFELENGEKLTAVIQNIIQDSGYSEKAKRLSNMLQNQPIDPKFKLLKHAEFAAKFGSLPGLTLHSRHLTFIQYHSLDIIIGIIVIVVLTVYIFVKIVNTLKLRRSKQKKA